MPFDPSQYAAPSTPATAGGFNPSQYAAGSSVDLHSMATQVPDSQSMVSSFFSNLGAGISGTTKSLVDPIKGGINEVKNDTSRAFQGGVSQIKQGASEFGKDGDIVGPSLKIGAGIVNSALSPLAAPFKPVSEGIKKYTDAVVGVGQDGSDPFNDFANSKAGQVTAQAMEPIANAGTIAQGALVAGEAPAAIEKGANVVNAVGEAAKPGIQAVGNDIATGAKAVADTAGKVSDAAVTGAKAVRQGISPKLSPEEATGQVIQGQTSDVPAAQRALSNLDTNGVKTYADLQSKLDSQISTLSKAQDALLEGDGRTFKIQQLATKVGDTGIVHNYVNDALGQLKDYFTKTNDVANLQKINDLIDKTNPTKGQGLTLKEVNDIAKMHGSKLNAFNANGELASGLSKQAAENTRMGLKNTVRNLLPNNASKTIDAHISDALDTKALIDKQLEKVNSAAQKTPKQGVVPKVVSKIIKGVDFVTGSPLKAIGREMGTAGNSSAFSPAEIEGNLAKNLKTIKNAK